MLYLRLCALQHVLNRCLPFFVSSYSSVTATFSALSKSGRNFNAKFILYLFLMIELRRWRWGKTLHDGLSDVAEIVSNVPRWIGEFNRWVSLVGGVLSWLVLQFADLPARGQDLTPVRRDGTGTVTHPSLPCPSINPSYYLLASVKSLW